MYPLQGTPREDEPIPSESSSTIKETTINWSLVAAASLYISWCFYLTLQDDEARLYFLNQLLKLLHIITRALGAMAITVEKAYYSYADTLHS